MSIENIEKEIVMSPNEIGKWVRREQVTSPEFEHELVKRIKALVGEYESTKDNSNKMEGKFENLQRSLQREREYALRLEANIKDKNVEYMKLYKRYHSLKSQALKSGLTEEVISSFAINSRKVVTAESSFDIEYNSRMRNSTADGLKSTQPKLYKIIISTMKKYALKMTT